MSRVFNLFMTDDDTAHHKSDARRKPYGNYQNTAIHKEFGRKNTDNFVLIPIEIPVCFSREEKRMEKCESLIEIDKHGNSHDGRNDRADYSRIERVIEPEKLFGSEIGKARKQDPDNKYYCRNNQSPGIEIEKNFAVFEMTFARLGIFKIAYTELRSEIEVVKHLIIGVDYLRICKT